MSPTTYTITAASFLTGELLGPLGLKVMFIGVPRKTPPVLLASRESSVRSTSLYSKSLANMAAEHGSRSTATAETHSARIMARDPRQLTLSLWGARPHDDEDHDLAEANGTKDKQNMNIEDVKAMELQDHLNYYEIKDLNNMDLKNVNAVNSLNTDEVKSPASGDWFLKVDSDDRDDVNAEPSDFPPPGLSLKKDGTLRVVGPDGRTSMVQYGAETTGATLFDLITDKLQLHAGTFRVTYCGKLLTPDLSPVSEMGLDGRGALLEVHARLPGGAPPPQFDASTFAGNPQALADQLNYLSLFIGNSLTEVYDKIAVFEKSTIMSFQAVKDATGDMPVGTRISEQLALQETAISANARRLEETVGRVSGEVEGRLNTLESNLDSLHSSIEALRTEVTQSSSKFASEAVKAVHEERDRTMKLLHQLNEKVQKDTANIRNEHLTYTAKLDEMRQQGELQLKNDMEQQRKQHEEALRAAYFDLLSKFEQARGGVAGVASVQREQQEMQQKQAAATAALANQQQQLQQQQSSPAAPSLLYQPQSASASGPSPYATTTAPHGDGPDPLQQAGGDAWAAYGFSQGRQAAGGQAAAAAAGPPRTSPSASSSSFARAPGTYAPGAVAAILPYKLSVKDWGGKSVLDLSKPTAYLNWYDQAVDFLAPPTRPDIKAMLKWAEEQTETIDHAMEINGVHAIAQRGHHLQEGVQGVGFISDSIMSG